MAVNEKIYEPKYEYRAGSWVQGKDKLKYLFKTTDTLNNILKENPDWQAEQVWDNSNVYSTYDPEKYGYGFFGSSHSTINIEYPEGKQNSPTAMSCELSDNVKINLRYIFEECSTLDMGGGNGFMWKGLESNYGDKITLQSLFTGGTYSYQDPNWNYQYGAAVDKTRELKLTEGSFPLNSSSYRFVTDINRNNIFYIVELTLGYYNESTNTIVNITVPTDVINSFQTNNSPYIDYEGHNCFITNIYVRMLVMEMGGSQYQTFGSCSRWQLDGGGQINAWDSGTVKPSMNLYIVCEKVVNGNCYYFSLPIVNNSNSNFTCTLERGNYKNGNMTYLGSELSPWSMQGTMSVIGGFERETGYNTITSFYSIPKFERSLNGLVDGKYYINDDSSFFYRSNTGGGEAVRFIGGLNPIISIDEIFRMFACTLIPFKICCTGDSPDIVNSTTRDCFVGIRNEDGLVEGDYESFIFGETVLDEELRPEDFEPFDPYEEPELPVTPDDYGDIPTGWLPYDITSAFTKYYILGSYELDCIGQSLWGNLIESTTEDETTLYKPGKVVLNFILAQAGLSGIFDRDLTLSSILDYFVSLKYFPIPNFRSYFSAMVEQDYITVGTGITRISASTNPAIQGHVYIPPTRVIKMYGGRVDSKQLRVNGKTFNNFLDYEPNVSASIYIPYCGTINVQPSTILDNKDFYIDLQYCLDIDTGDLVALVYKNGIANFPIAVANGKVGFDIPISGSNRQVKNNETAMNLANTVNDIFWNTIGGLQREATKAAAAYATGGEKGGAGDYGFLYNNGKTIIGTTVSFPAMVATSPLKVGISGSLASCIQPTNAFIQIVKHSCDVPSSYGNTFGFMANKRAAIKSQKGFFTCANPRLDGIPCNETERNEIYSLLTSGVYRV